MVGGLVAALFASICCIGPVLFAALGVGVGATGFLAGTAGFLKALLPYRPGFIGLTILLLGLSFYFAYRRPKPVCAPGEVCAPGATSGANRTLLWTLAVLALVLLLAPYWLGL
jgi:mercuric ion transport protein